MHNEARRDRTTNNGLIHRQAEKRSNKHASNLFLSMWSPRPPINRFLILQRKHREQITWIIIAGTHTTNIQFSGP